MERLIERDALARLWAKNASLWPAEQHEAETQKSNLSWLDLPEQLGALVTRVVARAADIEPAGFEDVVFVILGSSSFAAEAALQLPSARLGKRTLLLDNADPDSVQSDFESLGRHGRPVIRLHLARGTEEGLVQLETFLNIASRNRRPSTS